MKLENKIFCVFLILIISFFLFVPQSQASFSYGGYDFPDIPEDFNNFEYKFIYYDGNKSIYRMILSDMPILRDDSCDFDVNLPCFLVQFYHLKVYDWNPLSTDETLHNWVLSLEDNKTGLSFMHYMDSSSHLFKALYSSHDILHGSDENEGTVFFWRTPLMNSTMTQLLIGANICQIVMPIIPVGLIVLSMVLIIFLVRLVISRVI